MDKINGEKQQHDDSQQSVQEIMALGEQASRLLGAPVFNIIYNLQLREIFNQFLESSPKEQNKREGLYHQGQGLITMVERMGALVEEAKRILAEEEEKRDPRRQAQDYTDRQGFGLN